MKINIWKQIVDLGDGSSTTNIFPTRADAYEGYDEDGFCLISPEVPIQVESEIMDITGFEFLDADSAGWVPLDENGEVYRAEVSNAYSGGRGSTRKAVRKLYATEKRAAAYSPVGKAKEVFIL